MRPYASGKMLAVYSTHGNADIEKQVLDTTLRIRMCSA